MALDLATANIIGRLTDNPRVMGSSGCRFDVAVNQGKDKVSFFPVVCWDNLSEQVLKYCRKGTEVSVSGVLEARSYDTSEGPRKETRIVASSVGFGRNPASRDTVPGTLKAKVKADDLRADDMPEDIKEKLFAYLKGSG